MNTPDAFDRLLANLRPAPLPDSLAAKAQQVAAIMARQAAESAIQLNSRMNSPMSLEHAVQQSANLEARSARVQDPRRPDPGGDVEAGFPNLTAVSRRVQQSTQMPEQMVLTTNPSGLVVFAPPVARLTLRGRLRKRGSAKTGAGDVEVRGGPVENEEPADLPYTQPVTGSLVRFEFRPGKEPQESCRYSFVDFVTREVTYTKVRINGKTESGTADEKYQRSRSLDVYAFTPTGIKDMTQPFPPEFRPQGQSTDPGGSTVYYKEDAPVLTEAMAVQIAASLCGADTKYVIINVNWTLEACMCQICPESVSILNVTTAIVEAHVTVSCLGAPDYRISGASSSSRFVTATDGSQLAGDGKKAISDAVKGYGQPWDDVK